MRKLILFVFSVLLIASTMTSIVSAEVIYYPGDISTNSGIVIDDELGYASYIDTKGIEHHIDSRGVTLDEFVVNLNIKIDMSEYESGNKTDFFGVEIIRIEPLFNEDDTTADNIIYGYLVVIKEIYGAAEAEAIFNDCENISSFNRNYFVFDLFGEAYVDGDINGDDVVDAFDCLIVKGIYFETYEANEDEITRADLNGDGEIDMFDYLEVKSIYFEQ